MSFLPPPVAKTAMAASGAMATAKKRTNSTIILPSGFYGLGGVAARPIAVRLPDASTWLECLTSGRVTVLKPSLSLFGDFLEISAARGQAFASVRQDAECPTS